MLHTLALAAALTLAPAQNLPLAISNDRLTMLGEFGPTRPDNKYLPGDRFYLAFDIENLKADKNGVFNYSMGMEVNGPSGKFYEQPTFKLQSISPLGGNKVPARAFFVFPSETPAGKYTAKLTATDLETKASKTLEKTFEVLPKAFAMVSMFIAADDNGQIPAPLTGFPGQVLYLSFHVIGFGTTPSPDKKDRWPDVKAEMRVYDQNSKPTTDQPFVLAYNNGGGKNSEGLPFAFIIPLNRVGAFNVEVKAECKLTGKTAKTSFPITVLQPSR